MVERTHSWFDKKRYVGSDAAHQAVVKEFLGQDDKGTITLLISCADNDGKIELYRENVNKLIDSLGEDESTWEGKKFFFKVEIKTIKGVPKNIFSVVKK